MSEYGSIPTSEAPASSSVSDCKKRKILAEVVGTFILVQVGCGGIAAATYNGAVTGTFQIGAIWFVGALLAVFSTAAISGAHLNPAVSLSFALIRPNDFSTSSLIEYSLAQLVGGILAGIVNFLLFRPAIGGEFTQATASAFGDYWSESSVGGPVQAMLVEAFGTAVLTFVVFAATNPKNNVPDAVVPVLVASAIGGVISVLGSTTGAGINPARDFGPRLATSFLGWGSDAFSGFYVYIIGPLVGGPIGAFIADTMYA